MGLFREKVLWIIHLLRCEKLVTMMKLEKSLAFNTKSKWL
jgi:hypothetical protein